MRRSIFAATVSAIALVAGGQSAWAQTAPELRLGATVNGTLNGQDSTGVSGDEGEYRYEDYSIRAREGQRLQAIMRSSAFDTYLQVFAAGAEGDDAIASDDDGLEDGSTDSRLRFVAPADGAYTLRARTLSGLEGGAFTLALSERPPAARAPRPAAIRLGAPVTGALHDGDPEDDDAGRFHDYSFRARANERFVIKLESDDFDPIVRVGQISRRGGAFIEQVQNDDAASGGLNSYLVFTAPNAGEYIIRATSLGGDGEGDFVVSLSEPPPPLVAQTIAVGGSVEGELTESDGSNDEGVRADAYRFTVAAGQRVDISLKSSAFDAYLELYDASGESLDQDDDGSDDTDSQLVHSFSEAGEYTVQVRAIGDTLTGAYTLALAEAEPEPTPTALPFAEVVQGEITPTSARDDEGRNYVAYTFSGTEGNRVQVVMRSGDFDTFLQIGSADGEFEASGSDDDGLGEGTDSRLNYILPETGAYVIRASPLSSGDKGLFSIEMTDRGPQPESGSILIGSTARGTLVDTDAIADDGSLFDAYAIKVAKDDKLELTLVSNDFDAFLDVGKTSDGGEWESIATDDDSLSDTHAKLDWTVEEAGDYVIRARSFAQGQTGAYALSVARKP